VVIAAKQSSNATEHAGTTRADVRARETSRGQAVQPPRYGIGLIDAAPVQRSGAGVDEEPERVHALARAGVAGAGQPLPHLARIQQSFGRYDVSGIVAHTDAPARQAARSIGAHAYASGKHVAFAATPSLRIAAHEAAHVVQQRGRVQLSGGVGRAGDAYERHADAVAEQVVRGESAESTLATLAGPSHAGPGFAAGEGGLVQRSTALDVVGVAAGNFAWSYMKQLIAQYAIEASLAKLLESACLGLIDYGVRITGIDAYFAAMNPYLEVLNAIKKVITAIPEPIRVLLTYGIGWCIRKFSDAYMFGAITEAHINVLLIEGVEAVAILGGIIDFLYELGTKPTQTIYKGIWSVVQAAGLTTASSFSALLFGSAEAIPTPKPSATSSGVVAPAPKPKPMVDAELGWFWLEAHQPTVARWQQDRVERGGLQLEARFGVKVLGNVLGTQDFARLRVPYAGDWQLIVPSLSLVSEPIELGGLFQVGAVTLQKVRLDHNGVKFVHVVIAKLGFGKDLLTADEITMTYRAESASDRLHLRGAAKLAAFGHQLAGRFDVQIDAEGELAGGEVTLEVPETFELVKDRLTLANPRAWAKWNAEGETDLGIGGDLQLELIDSLEFASTGTILRYVTGKGLIGEVDKVWLNIPIHKGGVLRFELTKGVIDGRGFHAGKVALIYAYGEADVASNPDTSKPSGTSLPDAGSKLSKEQVGGLIPGFDMGWIETTGLETLVVNLSATDVDISSAGLDVGQLSKEITKFKAHLFGLGAEFDAVARTGKISGELNKKIDIPAIVAKVLVVPGVHANFGLRTDIGFGAALAATAQRQDAAPSKPTIHPWKLGGKAKLTANAGIQLEAGIGVGIPYLAEVSGNLFARAEAGASVSADVTGTVLWDDAAHSLALPTAAEDKPSATLALDLAMKAAIGAQVRAQLFYFIDTELWSYRFVEWDLGTWSLAAKLVATPDGGYDIITTKSGFGGERGVPTTTPIVEKARVTATAVIEDHIAKHKKIEDVHQMWRLVHDIQDPGFKMDRDSKRGYFEMLGVINGTGQDLDAMSEQVLGYVRQRSEDDSLLMSLPEWLAYSTTGKTFGEAVTGRKSIKPVDDAIAEYHATLDREKSRKILVNLISVLIPKYLNQWFVSRKDMAEKLLTDAKRELARIS
jgi:hypothetical protein